MKLPRAPRGESPDEMTGEDRDEKTPDGLREESIRRMHAGISLLERGMAEDALACFREAVEMRERMPWREEPESAWLLAASWIHCGDVLLRLRGEDFPGDVLHALDRGIEAMNHVPLGDHPAFPDRLILSWVKRATLCGEEGRGEEARAGFARAEALFGEWGPDATPGRLLLASMFHANRARFLIGENEGKAAWHDARRAVDILRDAGTEPAVLLAGAKARGIQCRALALLLDEPDGLRETGDWIAEATDSAEEALRMAGRHGCTEPWVEDLVRYGAKIYRVCQPQFLGDFLCEWLAGDFAGGALREEMRVELLLARADVEGRVLIAPHDTGFVEKQVRILQSIRKAERRLGFMEPGTRG